MNQSGRAGDEAKKSPAKSERVGITDQSYGDIMFDNKRNTKKCDMRFQAISMY